MEREPLLETIAALQAENQSLKQTLATMSRLQVLPGTPYVRYALPLDYQPSRAYGPRWGAIRPPIEPLDRLFAGAVDSYRPIFACMADSAPDLLAFIKDWKGIPFAVFDLLALVAMLRLKRPGFYFEIGSGASTKIARWAIERYQLGSRIISIEPNNRSADDVCDMVLPECLESVDPATFDRVTENDILFVDGSHRSFMNSDVTVFMIDILPRLKPGVLIHIHDINLPYDYDDWAKPWYWNEQYLLAVFMIAAAERIEPVFPTAWLDRSGRMEDEFRALAERSELERNQLGGSGSMWFRMADRG